MSIQEGRVLSDRYELEKLIAKGEMSSIYKARDRQLSRNVIVKILPPALSKDQEFISRFKHEALVAAGLNHTNIVKIYDRGQEGETYFITMEFIEGHSLADFLKKNPRVPPKSAVGAIATIAGALDFAHKNGIIHRDIKPSNILIAKDGTIKVVDFGIAHIVATETPSTKVVSVLGTASYFSPEQVQGKQVSAASDLYSLGIVFYEMLAGKLPFIGSSPLAVAHKHLNESPPPLPADTPAVLADIVMRLLEKEPKNRLQSCKELIDMLNQKSFAGARVRL